MASPAQLAARQKFINMIHAKKIATTAGPQTSPAGFPMVPMHPQMLQAIKQAPKGKIPPGLAKYLAAKKAGKATPKKTYNFKKAESKLGVVQH